jgi:eukaryotic-like serine/threonine-protein kinase
VMGTPSYMSPEQCRGLPSDHRADVFSTGVVLYELLTGARPFAGSIEAVTYGICHEHPRPPSEIAAMALPPSMDALVARSLAKDPAERFPDARAFQVALRLVAGEVAGNSGETTVINLAEVPLQPSGGHVWDDASLSTVERQLVRFVGPMARILVRQAAAQAHDTRELYALLALHIADPKERERFEAHQRPADASGSHAGQSVAPTRSRTKPAPSTGARVQAPRPLEQAFIDQTTSRLAVYLGPIARVVARNAARQARDSDEFVQLVAEHIGTQERHAFLREVAQGDAPGSK